MSKETIVPLADGYSLRAPAWPADCDYVRVVNPQGKELLYWSNDEFREDPAGVLGALVGAIRHPEIIGTGTMRNVGRSAP